MSKSLAGIIGCKDKKTNSLWHLIGLPNGRDIKSQQYHIGEKPAILYQTKQRQKTRNKTKTEDTTSLDSSSSFTAQYIITLSLGLDGCR